MMLGHVLWPFLLPITLAKDPGLPKAENSIVNYKKETKEDRRVLLSETYDMNAFGKARKALGCSFGVAINAVISQALKEYMERHGDTDIDQVLCG